MTVLLSLVAAASYGLSDFVGGTASRRATAWSVALMVQVAGAAVVLGLALAGDGSPTGSDLGWGVLAGLGNGVGTAFLYRGLARGQMGVVAPVSGVGAALLPVVVGVAQGERPAALVWLGIAVGLPAIWLVARAPAGSESAGSRAGGVLDGVVAGLGFGTLFVALSHVPESAGLYPLALNQVVAGAAIIVIAVALRASWVPRSSYAALGAVSGLLGAAATGIFMTVSRGGDLTVTAVLVSLYPAFTVLLAALLLRERVHRAQGWGLALCAVCVAFVAAG